MKKFIRIISIAICLLMVFSLLTACGSSISYSGSSLNAAKVGVIYKQSVATATGSEGIKYTLKAGSSLPVGLVLSQDGSIDGTPRNKSAAAVAFTVVASADGTDSAEAEFTISSIEEGTLQFSTETLLQSAHNKAYSLQFTVTGAATAVTYALNGDLPSGLSFTDGIITGTPTVLGEEKTFSVTASSTDCAPATKEFTLKIVLPWLTYAGKVLTRGNVGEFYSAELATATGTTGITYTLKAGSSLPDGLALSSSGFLSGMPAAQTTRHEFVVIAGAPNHTSAEATFTITIAAAEVIDDEGTINYKTKAIPDVYALQPFTDSSAVTGANTSNFAPVSYALAAGSSLPGDLTLLPNGTIRSEAGAPAAGTFTFSVVASATKCEPVTVAFTLTVLPPKLIFENLTISEMATVGQAFSYSIANASAPNGNSASITYSVIPGKTLPPGLVLSSTGVLSGTPTKAIKRAYVPVVASAPGYTSTESDIYINIQSPVETATRFEIEYIDLTGIVGAGFSGSAREEEMILPDTNNLGASNGYYLTFTYSPMVLTFRIKSDKIVSNSSLYIGLSSEIGDLLLDKTTFDIRVNNQSVISTLEVEGGDSNFIPFQRLLVASNVSLKEGDNIVEIEILMNNLLAGASTGAPGIDYIEFTNLGTATLSWKPMKWNLP